MILGKRDPMVIRIHLRNFLIPLALWIVSAGVTSYFVWHAVNGGRGLKAKEAYRAEVRALVEVRNGLQEQHGRLTRRIAMIGGDNVDREYLEEEVRRMLGYVHKGDVVIFTREHAAPAPE